MQTGDTLWILDSHVDDLIDTLLQSDFPSGITIRGDYPGREGTIKVLGVYDSQNIAIKNLRITDGSFGLQGVSDILIEHVTVSHQDKGLVAVLESDVDNVTIRNCHFHHLGYEGIECFARPGYSRDNWLIEDNVIRKVAGAGDSEGIGIQRMTNSVIQRNRVHDCWYGINIWESGNASSHDIVVRDNLVYNILGAPPHWPSRGLMMSGGSTTPLSLYNITFEGNTLYNIGKEGLRLYSPTADTPGLVCRDNRIGNVNLEYGTRNTEHVVATGPWVLENNIVRPQKGVSKRRR